MIGYTTEDVITNGNIMPLTKKIYGTKCLQLSNKILGYFFFVDSYCYATTFKGD